MADVTMDDPRPETPPEPGEFGLIRWIRERSAPAGPVVLGIGDDAAVVRFGEGVDVVVTTDMLMDGRHFRLEHDGPEAVGSKAMGVNLSDLAAMAAQPVAAVVAVALPRREGRAVDVARGVHAGLSEMAARFGAAIVGGDTNAWDGPLVVSVTAFGRTVGRGVVRRSGARPGDVVFVTGPLGGSLLGRHLRPLPRVAEAIALNAAVSLHALIDISDGLASDLGHILEESGNLGAVLDADEVPVHDDARAISRLDGRTSLGHALGDGEDFELCAVVSAADAERLAVAPPAGVRLFRVGEIIEGPGLWLREREGGLRPIEPVGFDHLTS